MKIKHYNNQFSSVAIHKMTKDFGASNTDTSTWRPTISNVRSFLAGSSNNFNKKLLYDFPDGKDNGEFVQTFIRSKGLDITEIETAEKRITKIVEDKKRKDKEEQIDKENEELAKKAFKKLADSAESAESSDSSDSSNTQSPNA